MKKVLFCLALALVSSPVLAFQVPIDRDGVLAESIDDVGVKVFTSTFGNTPQSPFVTTPASAALVNGSSIALYGVLTSTLPTDVGAGMLFVQVRASNTLNTTSELLIPEIVVSSSERNTFLVFDPPVIVPIRMVVNIRKVDVDRASHTVSVSFFYREIATSTSENVWIPIDERTGRKVHNSAFYGVQAASQVVPGNAQNSNIGADALDNTSDERLLSGTTTTIVKTFLYGWIAGTGTATNYAVFEDSEGVNATSPANPTMVPIFYNTEEFNGNVAPAVWRTKAFRFPWPIVFERGLTVRRNTSADQFRVLLRQVHFTRYR